MKDIRESIEVIQNFVQQEYNSQGRIAPGVLISWQDRDPYIIRPQTEEAEYMIGIAKEAIRTHRPDELIIGINNNNSPSLTYSSKGEEFTMIAILDDGKITGWNREETDKRFRGLFD